MLRYPCCLTYAYQARVSSKGPAYRAVVVQVVRNACCICQSTVMRRGYLYACSPRTSGVIRAKLSMVVCHLLAVHVLPVPSRRMAGVCAREPDQPCRSV